MIALASWLPVEFDASVFENIVLSDEQEEEVKRIAWEFLGKNSDGTESHLLSPDELVVEGVRFNRYDGFLVHLYSGGQALVVSLEQRDVVSFTNMALRNIVEHCNSGEVASEPVVPLASARQSALGFLRTLGKVDLADALKGERAGLERLGSERYYRFVWTQSFDENGVAPWLARVEILLNPKMGRVYSYVASVSKGLDLMQIDANDCARLVRAHRPDGREIVPLRMAAFLDHDRNGDVRPAWAVWVSEGGKRASSESTIVVDGVSGAISSSW